MIHLFLDSRLIDINSSGDHPGDEQRQVGGAVVYSIELKRLNHIVMYVEMVYQLSDSEKAELYNQRSTTTTDGMANNNVEYLITKKNKVSFNLLKFHAYCTVYQELCAFLQSQITIHLYHSFSSSSEYGISESRKSLLNGFKDVLRRLRLRHLPNQMRTDLSRQGTYGED